VLDLKHGGAVAAAARHYGLPAGDWLDLSTGISPWSWPVPELPAAVWRALPEGDDGLEQAAADCYGCAVAAVLPVPGSQYALQRLPALLPPGRVAVPRRGYAEHRAAWQAAGHAPVPYAGHAASLRTLVDNGAVDHAVVINPNNPTAETMAREALLAVLDGLAARGGLLLVDEAFADASPGDSLASQCPRPGLVVLRSLGKFFGLAGLRLGFALAPPELRDALARELPPWAVAHPARWVGRRALADTTWQVEQRRRLQQAAADWLAFLRQALPAWDWRGTALFASGSGPAAECAAVYEALARRAVLARLFSAHDGAAMLRLGLPPPQYGARAQQLFRDALEAARCAA